MTQPVFSEAVGGFGEPFPGQAGPFVTRPTAPYEHSTSSYLAANGFGKVDLDQDPFISVYMKPAGFLAITGAGAATGAFLAFRKTRSYGWAAGGAALGSFTPVVAALTYVGVRFALDKISR